MRGRIPSLDGLRGVCILLVLSAHLMAASNLPRFYFLGGLGTLSLMTFFVLSGFLITTVLMTEQSRAGTISLKNFYIRRFLRIFPVAYLYIGVIALLSFLGVIGLRPHDLTFAVSYLMDFHRDRSWYLGHLWYLTVEEQFYLVWPATVIILGFRRSFIAALTGLVFIPFIAAGLPRLFPTLSPALRVPSGTAAILVGCLLALRFDWLRTRPVFTSPLFSLALLGGVGFRLYTWQSGRSVPGLGFVIDVLIALTVFRCIVIPDDAVGRILNSRVLMFIGTLSYSIYVWQQLFLSPAPQVIPFPLNILAAGVAALASYYIVERPCLKLKNRFVGTKAYQAAKGTAPAVTHCPSTAREIRGLGVEAGNPK